MHTPDVTLKIGQMIQALKLHHELCRDEMPSSDCSYLKRIWLVLGLDECRFGLVLKTSLSRGGAFMEEQMLLFPLPVENLHAQFVWKMNSFFFFFSCFGCCTVAKFRGTICILLALEISPCVFAFVLPLQQACLWACTTTHLPSPLELSWCPCYVMVLWEMVCRNKSGVIYLF